MMTEVEAAARTGVASIPLGDATASDSVVADRVIETHVSTVFLVGDRAYKLKKPVHFEFVDLSTRAAREAMCHREVELNRRLAPDVYDGVADIIGPDGRPCDHLVVMRRMPEDRRLSTLVRAGDPRAQPAVVAVAHQLAAFHRRADRGPEIDQAATAETTRRRWRSNTSQLRAIAAGLVPVDELDRALACAEAYLDGRGPLFAARVDARNAVDGHGDLQADDVYVLDDGPRILDCLEFDDQLRQGDVVADVAFLAMDLERLGSPELATTFVRAYEVASGAPLPPSLLHLFVAYRAQVRLLVTCLRAHQPDAPVTLAGDARTLLDLCLDHLVQASVRLVLVGGPPGSGKTTVARALVDRPGWVLIRSDVVRKALAAEPPEARGAAPLAADMYSPTGTARTYQALLDQANRHLASGRSVVLDASWTAARDRERARAVAHRTSSTITELRCVVPPDVAARRAEARLRDGTDASDAGAAISLDLASRADPWPEAIRLPTDAPVDQVLDRARALVDDRSKS